MPGMVSYSELETCEEEGPNCLIGLPEIIQGSRDQFLEGRDGTMRTSEEANHQTVYRIKNVFAIS